MLLSLQPCQNAVLSTLMKEIIHLSSCVMSHQISFNLCPKVSGFFFSPYLALTLNLVVLFNSAQSQKNNPAALKT